MRLRLEPSKSASWSAIALRVRSRSLALSTRFLLPSMPADETAKARCGGEGRARVSPLEAAGTPSNASATHLELLVDALEVLDRRRLALELLRLELELLLEVRDLAQLRVALGRVLGLQPALCEAGRGGRRRMSTLRAERRRGREDRRTLSSSMDWATSALLASSSRMVRSACGGARMKVSGGGVGDGRRRGKQATHPAAPRTQSRASRAAARPLPAGGGRPRSPPASGAASR